MSTPQKHENRGHAELSASSSDRWINCPGSVLLSRGLPSESSIYADEGTAAHELAEKCLSSGTDPREHVGTVIKVHGNEFTVDQEMSDFVAVYVDHIRSLQAQAGVGGLIEHRFTLAKLGPPAPMHGTADFVLHDKKLRRLYVSDLKYGRGYVVDASNNSQLMYYALGAIVSLGLNNEVDEVHMTIVQPRAEHPDGPVRTEVIPSLALVEFGMDLLASAEQALKADQPLVTGKHCKFCKAKFKCPEIAQQALRVAGEEFEFDEEVAVKRVLTLPDPKLLTIEQIAAYLPKLDLLEDWIAAIRQGAHHELEQGREVPGYKLVNKRANRSWAVSEEEVIKLAKKNKLKKDQLYDKPSFLSPAKMEKLFKFPDSFTKSVSSGTTMAPSSDKRPAVTLLPPGEEFTFEQSGADDLL